uniref:Uncharacterized protein n=1 Tax=Arundo donax TaxID=35708 RepID=A0A0A9C080_ARUDO
MHRSPKPLNHQARDWFEQVQLLNSN